MKQARKPCGGRAAYLTLLCGCAMWSSTVGAAPAHPGAFDATVAGDDPLADVNAAFGVFESDLAFLEVRALPGEPFTVVVPIDGMATLLELWPYSVRSEEYRLIVQTGANRYEERPAGPERTLRGELANVPFSRAAGALQEDGLYAKIVLPDGTQRWIEPVSARVADAPQDLYIIYRNDDVIPMDATCGNGLPGFDGDVAGDFLIPVGVGGGGGGGAGAGSGGLGGIGTLNAGGGDGGGGDGDGTICTTELACDADFEFFEDWGSVNGVEDRINLVINTMNDQYENEVGITHEIGTIIVRSVEPDPYTETEASALLEEFRAHWNGNHAGIDRDIAQLFTGRNIDGSTIGIAYNGVICNGSFGYSVVQSTQGNFACVTDLSAHEFGHNWSADHCACPAHTMNPSLPCANTFNPTETVPEIIAFRDGRTCLECVGMALATLDTLTINKGDLRSGNLASLLDSDDDSVKIDSEPRGTKEITVATIDATSPLLNPSSIELFLESGVTANGVKTIIKIWNYDANRWDKLRTINQDRPDTPLHLPYPDNAGVYVDADGSMRIKLKMKQGQGTAFVSRYDWVEIVITP